MEKETREYLKEQGLLGKMAYAWMYYKFYFLGALVVLGVLASVLHSRHSQKAPAFQAFLINASAADEAAGEMAEAFSSYAGITEGEVLVNTTLSLTPGSQNSEYDLATIDHIEVEEEQGELDVIVADAWNFAFITAQGSILDLREVLSEEQLQTYKDRLYYVDLAELRAEQQKQREDASYFGEFVSGQDALASEARGTFVLPDPETMEDPAPVGICVSDSAQIAEYQLYPKTEAILGFAAGGRQPEKGLQFLEFLD